MEPMVDWEVHFVRDVKTGCNLDSGFPWTLNFRRVERLRYCPSVGLCIGCAGGGLETIESLYWEEGRRCFTAYLSQVEYTGCDCWDQARRVARAKEIGRSLVQKGWELHGVPLPPGVDEGRRGLFERLKAELNAEAGAPVEGGA